ncbi:hypothetical protein K9M48_02165 [Candidatus Gracilibacteria bacterium]|nr:hypothetical protein [Candidatus Gracilibacteria bacterium]
MPQKEKISTKNIKKTGEGLFIPGGLLLGMGFGFAFDNLVAGLFIGLGLGFIVFGILTMKK